MKQLIKHFLTPDHISFVTIFLVLLLFIATRGNIYVYIATGLWIFSFGYDLAETKSELLRKIEKWCKG